MAAMRQAEISFIELLASAGIIYKALPSLMRSSDGKRYDLFVSLREMTAPIMQHSTEDYHSIVIAVKGISPLKITAFYDEPRIDDIKGVIQIYDRCLENDPGTGLFVSNRVKPASISQAYDFAHNHDNHIGDLTRSCRNCEWINSIVAKTAVVKLLKGQDKVFRIAL